MLLNKKSISSPSLLTEWFGATFSSSAIKSSDVKGTEVQIGDPFTQKKLSDAITKEARDLGLYNAITDNGAGGFSSSVGEMGREGGNSPSLKLISSSAPLSSSYTISSSSSSLLLLLFWFQRQYNPITALSNAQERQSNA